MRVCSDRSKARGPRCRPTRLACSTCRTSRVRSRAGNCWPTVDSRIRTRFSRASESVEDGNVGTERPMIWLRFALLGLGTGALYALCAQGLVLIYRSSGVVNFAQSGFVLLGGYSYYELREVHKLSAVVAVAG